LTAKQLHRLLVVAGSRIEDEPSPDLTVDDRQPAK
jgi:hypothetical protein